MRDHVDDTNSTSAQQVVEKEFNTERLFVPDPHALGQLLLPPGALADLYPSDVRMDWQIF